jgi:F0F1-type ATP synthase assembly protein I
MALDPRRPAPQKQGSDVGEQMGAGLQFAASIALFLFLGMWLDSRLGTDPWLLIAGVLVGGTAGFWSIYRRLVVLPRERERERKEKR